jgi:hypothetical protein
MKLHWGAIPENKDFDPEAEGWSGIREPNPIAIQFIAVPVALAVIPLLGSLFYLIWPASPASASTWLIMIFMVGLIPAHELLHAICFPGGLHSPQTLIGIWPARLLFYAHYEGVMPRNRFLLTFAMPFLVLSLLPIVIIALTRWPALDFLFLSLVNGAAASGDIIGIFLVAFQVPRNTMVRNKGWRTYWKLNP